MALSGRIWKGAAASVVAAVAIAALTASGNYIYRVAQSDAAPYAGKDPTENAIATVRQKDADDKADILRMLKDTTDALGNQIKTANAEHDMDLLWFAACAAKRAGRPQDAQAMQLAVSKLQTEHQVAAGVTYQLGACP
jgi:hypothetical protein